MPGPLKEIYYFFLQPFFTHLSTSLRTDLDKLQRFEFGFNNPVFGLIILTAFSLLLKPWCRKKAFSYCLIVSCLLFLASQLCAHLQISIEGAGFTYCDILKFIVWLVILIVSIYYFMIKAE